MEQRSMDCFLKIHSNPFIIDKNSDFQKRPMKQVGREQIMRNLSNDLIDYFDIEDLSNLNPFFIAVQGEAGSGKTLFAKSLIEQLKRNKNFLRDGTMGPDYCPILCSALNAESQFRYLNIWRPVLR